jgi:serine/threonine protein kinase
MPLAARTRLGPYELLAPLGAGGMGEVYKARDTRLDRHVAIKILPSALMRDEQRRTRFTGEAKAASALNHPNIIAIYDIGEAEGASFIAMEFVPGRTLDRLIGRGLSVRDALNYGTQIADALASAHAAGIVHRDLKPANVMVTDEGRIKVLDFGIAKLIQIPDRQDSAAETETMDVPPATEPGTLIGTSAYMSPEQAEGKKVDTRSDIFSFGSLLYEMATGKRAFQGETAASTMAAILNKEPAPVRELASGVPPELERIIAHCLRKDPSRRFQHIDDVKTLLLGLKEEVDSGTLLAQRSAVRPTRSRPLLLMAAGAVLLSAAAVGAVLWSNRTAGPFSDPSPIRLTSDAGLTTQPTMSSDGKLLAFASDRSGANNLDIWVKQIGGAEALRLTTDEADDYAPDLASDGQRIAFQSERTVPGIFVVSTLGGDARPIAAGGKRPRFSPDGKWIAFWIGGIGADFVGSGGSRVVIVPSNGGAARVVATNLVSARHPIWSPDGTRLLVYGTTEHRTLDSQGNDWWVVPVDGGPAVRTGAFDVFRRQKLSVFEVMPSAWTSDNHVVFTTMFGDSTNVWQVPISDENDRITEPPTRLTAGTGFEGFPAVATGSAGTLRLAFANINENIDVWGIPFARNGGANRGEVSGEMQRLTQDAAFEVQPALSRDGSVLAFATKRTASTDIWMKDLKSGKEVALTNSSETEWHPVISPDASTVAYQVIEGQKEAIHAIVRGGNSRKLCDECMVPWDLSTDGSKMLYWFNDQRRIGLLDVASGSKVALLSDPRFAFLRATFSPDDRWIAFHAITQTGTPSNFIAPFTGTPPFEREWIPVTGGSSYNNVLRWSPDGNLIYFLSSRDGFHCLWAQRLEPRRKRPIGAAFAVHHLHSARRSLGNVIVMFQEMEVSDDRLVFPLNEQTGNIWMIER